jgi:hypothetical protein
MTKAPESGENEITEEARSEARRAARDVCDILRDMLRKARAAGDTPRVKKIERAQKYLGCRNVRKRRGKR